MTAELSGIRAALARIANRSARFQRQTDDGPPFVEVAGIQVFVYVHRDGALRVSLHFDEAGDHPELWPDHERGVPVKIDVGGYHVYEVDDEVRYPLIAARVDQMERMEKRARQMLGTTPRHDAWSRGYRAGALHILGEDQDKPLIVRP